MGGLSLQAGGAPMAMADILAVFVVKAKVEAEEAQSEWVGGDERDLVNELDGADTYSISNGSST